MVVFGFLALMSHCTTNTPVPNPCPWFLLAQPLTSHFADCCSSPPLTGALMSLPTHQVPIHPFCQPLTTRNSCVQTVDGSSLLRNWFWLTVSMLGLLPNSRHLTITDGIQLSAKATRFGDSFSSAIHLFGRDYKEMQIWNANIKITGKVKKKKKKDLFPALPSCEPYPNSQSTSQPSISTFSTKEWSERPFPPFSLALPSPTHPD